MTLRIALVSPLPLLETRHAQMVTSMLPELSSKSDISLYVRGPEQTATEILDSFQVHPVADLPGHLDSGAVDLPVYLMADELYYAHQIRYVEEFPGLLVLLEADLRHVLSAITRDSGDEARFREIVDLEHGDGALQDGDPGDLPLALCLATKSLSVLSSDPGASRLVDDLPPGKLHVIPSSDESPALSQAIIDLAGEVKRPRGVVPRAMESDLPSVEVLTVSFNARDLISECVQSVLDQNYPNFKFTVVDNASSDGTAEFIRETFPSVNVIQSSENLGFAGGNNIVLQKSDADYVALLNQDATARKDWILEMVRVAERDPAIGVVGTKMLMRRCPTILNSTGIAMNRTGFCIDRNIGEKDDNPSPVPEEVLGVCGGAMLIRTQMVREIGGLEESFFMYFEDLDFSWRVWLSGRKVVYAPLAVVVHDWHGDLDEGEAGESEVELNEKTRRRRVLCEQNRILCLLRNYEFRSLRRELPELWRSDRVRLAGVRAAIDRGEPAGYFQMVASAIRRSWTKNLAALPRTLWRRRAVQRLRKVNDSDLEWLFDDWEGEPSFIGDLYSIHDRFSATASEKLAMGTEDSGSLGPGFYGAEAVPGTGTWVRWTKDRAWVYLKSKSPSRRIRILASSGPVPVDLEVSAALLGRASHRMEPGTEEEIILSLGDNAVPGQTVEVRIECNTFRPCDHDMGPDMRDLGIRISEISFA